eukprot:scaffold22.g6098.t1
MLQRKPTRIELKAEDKEEYEAIKREQAEARVRAGLEPGGKQPLSPLFSDNYFFDGAGQELSSRRVVLRVRLYDESKKAVITVLKDGIGRAPEEEEEIEPAVALRCLEDPNLLLQLDSPLLRGLASSLGVGSLVGLGGFLNVRQEYEWRGQLLELDETRYEWGTLYELECETSEPERLRGDLEAFLGQRNIPFAYSANTKLLAAAPGELGSGRLQQEPPALGNQWIDDVTLREQLERLLPPSVMAAAADDLRRWGDAVVGPIKELGRQAEAEPPRLCKDEVVTCPAWAALKAASAREGLVALAYERPYGPHSRLVQARRGGQAGAVWRLLRPVQLPLGDDRRRGAAAGELPELREALGHLTSRDPQQFWTSGQWMTETGGGSDVAGATATLATPLDPGATGVGSWHSLSGYKWFTSAADGEVAMALARERDPGSGAPIPGAAGLALYYVPVRRDADGCPQGFEVVRLKDKLGTRQLPTAELRLTGMRALKVSPVGRGVAAISPMLTITRLHNAVAAVAYMRRLTALAGDYARRRTVFGRPLCEQPLAVRSREGGEGRARIEAGVWGKWRWERVRGAGRCRAGRPDGRAERDGRAVPGRRPEGRAGARAASRAAAPELRRPRSPVSRSMLSSFPAFRSLRRPQIRALAWMEVRTAGSLVLLLELARLLGLQECGAASAADARLLRLLVPLAKAHTAKEAVAVLPIWEGTTAVQSLDLLRVLAASRWQAGAAWLAGARARLAAAAGAGEAASAGGVGEAASAGGAACPARPEGRPLLRVAGAVEAALEGIERQMAAMAAGTLEAAEACCRNLATAMSRAHIGVLLVEHAAWAVGRRGREHAALLAAEWCREALGGQSPGTSGQGEQLLAAARVMARVGEPLSQPRARY